MMKLFKTVVILGLAILSLGSSVAFGCVAEQVAATKIDGDKTVATQPVTAPATNAGQTQAGQPNH